MFPRVKSVKHVKDYTLELGFADGTVCTTDFRRRVAGGGGVFTPLQSFDYFKQVSVDQEAGAVVWPNGVDFCPDVLYADALEKCTAEMANDSV